MIPRFLHKWYANVCGYFWLPCPICGRMFGGHEVTNDNVSLERGNGMGTIVCGDVHCAIEATRRNVLRTVSQS